MVWKRKKSLTTQIFNKSIACYVYLVSNHNSTTKHFFVSMHNLTPHDSPHPCSVITLWSCDKMLFSSEVLKVAASSIWSILWSLVCRQPFSFSCVVSHTDCKEQVMNSSSLCHKTFTNNTSVTGTEEYTRIPFAVLLLLFSPFFDQTESCNLLFKLLSNSLASKRVSFDSGNSGKVTGIKKIDGMSQEDFKLY